MSLLMDALRKAEEAKRQAAHKEKAGASELQLSVQQEAHRSAGAEESFQDYVEPQLLPPRDTIEFETSPVDSDSDERNTLDVEFDFKIDEDFGMTPQPAVQDTSGHQPREFSLAESEPDPEPVVELSLAQEPEIIGADSAQTAPENSLPEVALEYSRSQSVDVITRDSDDVEPMRAQRTEDNVSLRPEAALKLAAHPERDRVQETGKPTAHVTETMRRKSAQAVFHAKSGKSRDNRGRRLMAIAAVLMLLPLSGGAYLLLQEMGILATSNTYNIPTAGFDSANIQWPESAVESVPTEPPVDVAQAEDEGAAPVEIVAPVPDSTAIAASLPVSAEAPEPLPAVTSAQTEVADVTSTFAADSPLITEPVVQFPSSVVPADVSTAEPTAAITTPASQVVAAIVIPPQSTSSPSAISITRSDVVPQVDSQLTLAYAAYQMQDFIRARAHYQQALRNTPRNRDAMLGVAAVSTQLGDSGLAREMYAKLLEYDPRDALARVGLMQTSPAGDALGLESELKSLVETQSDSAPVAFALGNLYASQGRWNEAQQSYYDALLAAKAKGDPVTPDYAFNLAVSLERLNQPRAALGFYHEAQTLSQSIEPGFDMAVLLERIDAMTRALP